MDSLAGPNGTPELRWGPGSLDHLVGMVHVRDLVAAARSDPSTAVSELAQPTPVVP
jgi:CBS domain containing-hemolysin-like protein